MVGVVVKFFPEKAYGFVRSAGKDYFFHLNDREEDAKDLVFREGMSLQFEKEIGAKGHRAVKIRRCE